MTEQPLTRAEIAELLHICEAATLPDWWLENCDGLAIMAKDPKGRSGFSRIVVAATSDGDGFGVMAESDANFIIHARTMLPRALATIRALCEMLDEAWLRGQPPRGVRAENSNWPDWPTAALASKEAREGMGSTSDEILEDKP